MKRVHWIHEALEDLEFFALGNGLPKLALKVRETRKLAKLEVESELHAFGRRRERSSLFAGFGSNEKPTQFDFLNE